ncbi:MAG TPA: beta-propeller fold lactonase family protein [Candidatus Polarisedimenticolia bacterium]|nr:beta-propeller fold lactonase family protein [Candidatus Polarisedimenticolia bacterium]
MMRKLRGSFTLIAIAASIVAATAIFMTVGSAQVPTTPTRRNAGGHLYMQTNDLQNGIIHYHWSANGALAEVERVATGGAGSGQLSFNRPNDFEGAGSVILTPDRRFLFASNGGDNSVSSFAIDKEGRLTLLNVKKTGNTEGGGAKSLAYAPSSRTIYVLHTFGPDHLRLMSVDSEGKLTPRPEKYSVDTKEWNDRVPTMAALSPDGKFLVVGTTFDELPTRKNPDGSLILWVPDKHGALHLIASNAPDPDGIVVFPVAEDAALREPSFYDARGASPFYIAFLHNRPDTFVVGYAVSDAVSVGKIDVDGKISVGPLVKINTSSGAPSELCWLAVSPDDRFVFATDFGYSYMSSFRIDASGLSIAKDPASKKVRGDGTFRAINGSVSSGPSDSWISPDGAYLYEIYGNASKLVGYATKPDGSLEEVVSVAIPYNSPEGLTGF